MSTPSPLMYFVKKSYFSVFDIGEKENNFLFNYSFQNQTIQYSIKFYYTDSYHIIFCEAINDEMLPAFKLRLNFNE